MSRFESSLIRTWKCLCPIEFGAIAKEPFFSDFINEGTIPHDSKNAFLLETFFESLVIAFDNEIDSGTREWRGSTDTSVAYLELFSLTSKDTESIVTPLAISLIVRAIHQTPVIDVEHQLERCIQRLINCRKVDPLSFFALGIGLITRKAHWFQRAIMLHSEDHLYYSLNGVHPILPLVEGTSSFRGIKLLLSEWMILVASGVAGDALKCKSVFSYYGFSKT